MYMQVDLSYLGLACMSSRMYMRHVQIDWLGLHDDLTCWLVVVRLTQRHVTMYVLVHTKSIRPHGLGDRLLGDAKSTGSTENRTATTKRDSRQYEMQQMRCTDSPGSGASYSSDAFTKLMGTYWPHLNRSRCRVRLLHDHANL